MKAAIVLIACNDIASDTTIKDVITEFFCENDDMFIMMNCDIVNVDLEQYEILQTKYRKELKTNYGHTWHENNEM